VSAIFDSSVGWRSYEKVVAVLGGYGERIDRLDQPIQRPGRQ